jgi:chemotaxis protein MotB
MARKKKPEEHVNHERWLVSYADFITLLFAFFVVMFAASNADQQKVGQVAQSVQQGFSELALFDPSSSIFSLFGSEGLPSDDFEVIGSMSAAFPNRTPQTIEEVRNNLSSLLKSQLEDGDVRMNIDERGLTISLAEAGFFASGSATIQSGALPVLGEIAEKILALPYHVRIEGHTDDLPINTARFPSNWELSNARSTYVLRYLINNGSIPPSRLSASGYAEFRPVADNDTSAGRSMNRRVDIVVLNTATAQLEPKSFAQRSLEETGMPSVFLESDAAPEEPEATPAGD